MRGQQAQQVADRLEAVEALLAQLHRSVERIEIVTVVREPNTGMSADAYNGLRKQVIGAIGERTAHLHQLAQFDSALRMGATIDDLAALVREWVGQSGLEIVEDPAHEDAFELVGPSEGAERRLVRPAYVDGVTKRVVHGGIAERVQRSEPESAQDSSAPSGPEEHAPNEEPAPEAAAPVVEETTTTAGGTQ